MANGFKVRFRSHTRPMVLPFNCLNSSQFYGIEIGQEKIWTLLVVNTLKFDLNVNWIFN